MTDLMRFAADWPALDALLDEALNLPAEQRAAWLDGLAGDRAKHRDSLHRLLCPAKDAIAADDFLDELPRLHITSNDVAGEVPGGQVGPYRLLSRIGQGGMGSVWLAERSDGLMKRRIALKLPHRAWGEAFAARLAREREILSSLEHPHIARLYDAGVDGLGGPFLAMEYVEGRAIDAYFNEQGLDIDARIALLLQVMAAVAYAHSRLIVHRDLKPANILVDSDGQAKLLDFGIAKLLEADHADGEAARSPPPAGLTEVGGRALTPDYASPEQIRGEPLGTASDIYSMGVVAFELLAGTKPYRLKRGSVAELEEAITSAEPPLASAAAGQRATDRMATNRMAPDRTLARQLRGDIDSILNRALKKSPAERYSTMEAFAQDLRRYRAGEPVEARPDSLGYRSAKFMRRHRLQVSAGLVAGAALLSGATMALWQAREARAQALHAVAEAKTARAVQGFIESVFRASSGDQADPEKARAATAVELLDRGAERIDAELLDVPAARLQLLNTLASMYEDMVLVDRQLALQRKRLALARSSTGLQSDETVLAMADVAHALTGLEQRDAAAAMLKEGAAILDARHDDSSRARLRIELMQASLDRRIDPEHGLAAATRAVAIARRSPPDADLVLALHMQGDNAYSVGQNELARAAFAQAVALCEATPALGANMLSIMVGSLGNAQRALGVYDEALRNLQKGLALERQRHTEPMTLHFAELALGNFLFDTGRFRESAELLAPAASWARDHDTSFGAQVAMMPAAHGRALIAYGRAAQGLAEIETAQAMAAKVGTAPELDIPLLAFRAGALIDLGRMHDARETLDRARSLLKANEGKVQPVHVDLVERRWWVASGSAPQALAAFRRVRAANNLPPLPAPGEPLRDQVESAWLELEAGDTAAAQARASTALAAIRAGRYGDFERDLEARAELVVGRASLRQHRAADALPTLENAVALHRAVYDPRHSSALTAALLVLAACRSELGDEAGAALARTEARGISADAAS